MIQPSLFVFMAQDTQTWYTQCVLMIQYTLCCDDKYILCFDDTIHTLCFDDTRHTVCLDNTRNSVCLITQETLNEKCVFWWHKTQRVYWWHKKHIGFDDIWHRVFWWLKTHCVLITHDTERVLMTQDTVCVFDDTCHSVCLGDTWHTSAVHVKAVDVSLIMYLPLPLISLWHRTHPIHSVHCALCTVHYALCTVQYVLCTVHCTLYTLHWVLCAMCNV